MWERLSEGKIKLLRVRSVLRRIDKKKCSAVVDRALAVQALECLLKSLNGEQAGGI